MTRANVKTHPEVTAERCTTRANVKTHPEVRAERCTTRANVKTHPEVTPVRGYAAALADGWSRGDIL